jgi:hypothetical protein
MTEVVVVNVSTPPVVQVSTPSVSVGSTTVSAGGVDQIEPYTLFYPDNLTTIDGNNGLYLEGPYSLSSLRFTLGTASVSGAVVLDLRCNEVSIFAGAKPTIAENQRTVLATNLATKTTFAKGDELKVSIIDGGLSQTSADLTVTLRLKRLF